MQVTRGGPPRLGERVVLFDTPARFDSEHRRWSIPLHAWVFEPEDSVVRLTSLAALLLLRYGQRPLSATEARNFRERANLFFADNKGHRRVRVDVAGRPCEIGPTAAHGHAWGRIERILQPREAPKTPRVLSIRTLHDEGDGAAEARVHLVPPHGVSVISDLDDTVKVSHVEDRKKLLAHTFFHDFVAVEGMVETLRRWHAQGAALHFVSSSPWHLYPPLRAFVERAGFPPATFHLRRLRLKDSTLLEVFARPTRTKPRQIEPLLAAYPARQFVLVGDSGQEDPEVYAALLRKHPEQIARVYVRNVNGAEADHPRFRAAFAGLDPGCWRLFDDPASLELPEPARR